MKSTDPPSDNSSLNWRTRLIHSTAKAPPGFQSLTTPTYRASTTVFNTLADTFHGWRPGGPYAYGIYGTPTTLELAARIAEIEQARHTFIVPSGLSAIALIYLAYCTSGTHALVPESAYGNSHEIAENLLPPLNIEVESYDPMIGGEIDRLRIGAAIDQNHNSDNDQRKKGKAHACENQLSFSGFGSARARPLCGRLRSRAVWRLIILHLTGSPLRAFN